MLNQDHCAVIGPDTPGRADGVCRFRLVINERVGLGDASDRAPEYAVRVFLPAATSPRCDRPLPRVRERRLN